MVLRTPLDAPRSSFCAKFGESLKGRCYESSDPLSVLVRRAVSYASLILSPFDWFIKISTMNRSKKKYVPIFYNRCRSLRNNFGYIKQCLA